MAQAFPYLLNVAMLLATLGPLLMVQRLLHSEVQRLFLLLTHRQNVALGLFALLFFPGVLLHEVSHWLMAQLLMVNTGGLSLLPQLQENGQLRLGYVETASSDWLRDSLIGLAPLLSGGAAVAYLAGSRLGFLALANVVFAGDWSALWPELLGLTALPDFWLWFYLAFAISSTMLPSESDRHAWLPLALVIGVLVVAALVAGGGTWMLTHLAPRLEQLMQLLIALFGVSLALHLLILLPVRLMRALVTRVSGYDLVEVH